MKKITPFKTKRNAVASLDNGGRFYNLLTQAKDGEISSAELGKAAGVFSGKQQMFLYLEMAISGLGETSMSAIYKQLSPSLKASAKKYKPFHYSPAEAAVKGKPSQSAIVTGTPTYIESREEFQAFIMIPIQTGSVTSFTMIPIYDHYDIYEVRDKPKDQTFLLAHTKVKKKLEPIQTRFGGIIKKLEGKKGKPQIHNIFLEALYYTPDTQKSC